MQLFIEGHNRAKGYAISRSWSDHECSTLPPPAEREMRPVRYFQGHRKAACFVERYNRRFATSSLPAMLGAEA
jgi:hypothetical protein